jgi:hypothetical protein
VTTTANKHGLRKAADERRSKHAQRSPLPQKQEPIPGTPEFRESQIEAGMERKRVRRLAETEALRAAIAPKTAAIISKSISKADVFAAEIRKHGWSVTIEGDAAVTATRGNETIWIQWVNGVFQNTATYTIADRTVKLRNASAAKSYAERSPETGAEELARVGTNRFFRKRETPPEEVNAQRQPLPFDPATALDDDVFSALAGRKVTWHNRFREVAESAVFPVDYRPPFVHMSEYDGERIVNFCCPATGFRSFRLSALLSVSRGKSVTVKRAAADAKRQAVRGSK